MWMALGKGILDYTPTAGFSIILLEIGLWEWSELLSDSAVRSVCTTDWCWGCGVWASLSGKASGELWLCSRWLCVLVHAILLLPSFFCTLSNSGKQSSWTTESVHILIINNQITGGSLFCFHGFTFEWYLTNVKFLNLCCFVMALLWGMISFFFSFHRLWWWPHHFWSTERHEGHEHVKCDHDSLLKHLWGCNLWLYNYHCFSDSGLQGMMAGSSHPNMVQTSSVVFQLLKYANTEPADKHMTWWYTFAFTMHLTI